jgi:hypothetical protein
MGLYVAFFRMKAGADLASGMQAFQRRQTFQHPERANVLGEYWVNGNPQVVLVWEAEDEGPGDYYQAAWEDLFDIEVCGATRPVTELPANLPDLAKVTPPEG